MNIPVIQVDRGGQVTYHGPGQIVAYPLVDIRRKGIAVREFVNRIEQAIIAVLAHYGVRGERIAGAPGIYVNGDKIASLGLRVRRGCTFPRPGIQHRHGPGALPEDQPLWLRGFAGHPVVCTGAGGFPGVEQRLIDELAQQLGYSEVNETCNHQE